MAIGIYIEYEAKPGCFDELLARLTQDARQSLREDDGCLRMELARPRAGGDRLMLIELWRDQAAIDAHRDKPGHSHDWQEPLLVGKRVHVCDVLESPEPAAAAREGAGAGMASSVAASHRGTLRRCMAAWALAAAALLGLGQGTDAHAQPGAWPQRPVRMIVPYPPGAANDILARGLAQRLTTSLGQPVVVENRAGAGGHLGAEMVARAPADGYTLLIGTSGLIAIGPHVFRKLSYDPQKDLVPLVRFATVPYVFAVPASRGYRNLGDLVAQARANPGVLNFASSGNGSVPHLCGELFNLKAGVKMVHIPYKGGAQAISDLANDQVQLYCGGIPSLQPFVKTGRIRLLGLTAPRRSPLLPDEPTLAEQGVPGVDVNSWVGVFAPAAMPPELQRRVIEAIGKIMASEDMRQFEQTQGAEPEALSGADFAADLKAESQRWAQVVKASGAQVD